MSGSFPLGADLLGTVDERTGAFSIELPLSGQILRWDSQAAGSDRFGLGTGWAVSGQGFVDTLGGVRVVPAKSVAGPFDADDSVASGLAGYPTDDVRFAQTPGVLPARADGLAGERAYAFVLRELGGLVSYFDASGETVAKLDVHENRIDWVWGADHRLAQVVSETGVVTELDWSDPTRVEAGTRAGHGPKRVAWTLELDGGRLISVTDATGARTSFEYTASGVLSHLESASGAVTDATWRALPDGRLAVDRVTVIDPTTAEPVVERSWEPLEGLASGWPDAASPEGDAFRTSTTDGATRLVSTYSADQVLTGQATVLRSPSGDRVAQERTFTFPEEGDAPGHVERPTGMTLTHHTASGERRTVSEEYEFDELGRLTWRNAADGTVTTNAYDDHIPADEGIPAERNVPIGLPTLERTEAPDGSVTESRHTMNAAHSAVAITETFSGSAGPELTRIGRTEFDVEPDGFLSAERAYPQGGEGAPLVTQHTESVDLAAGTVTTTETVAAGTELAATTTRVADLQHGQQLAVTDPLGRTATATYDPAGRPTEATDPAGNTTRTRYRSRQADGVNATLTTTPDGVTVTEELDVLGRTVRTLDDIRDGVVDDTHARVAETRSYPAPGTVVVTDAWGWSTTTEQDPFGRVTRATVSSGLAQVVEHDEVAGTRSTGYTTTGDLADAELVTTEHLDLRGRVTGTSGTRADGLPVAPTVSEFDGFGRQTRSGDGAAETRVEHDVHGNPATTTITAVDDRESASASAWSADALVATRQFDERGASVEKTLTTADESRTGGRWEYDLLGREQTITDQSGAVTSYEYALDGQITRQESSTGAVTEYTYDPATRQLVATVTSSPVGATVRRGYGYDPATGRVLTVFDPVDPEATTVRYAYDAWGDVTEISYPDGGTIRHEYDANGRKVRTTDVAGATTEFAHDASGLLTHATQYDSAGAQTASVAYTYDDYARVTGIDRGNGVHTEVAYTSASEVASEATTGPDGAVQAARTYSYDATGNLTTRTDTVADPETRQASTTTTAYEYDQHRRLVSSSVHDGDAGDGAVHSRTEYTLNVSGDVTRERITNTGEAGAQETTTREFAYGPTGQLTRITTTTPDGRSETVTQTYDAAGNLTVAADGTRYVYNATNRPELETTPDGDLVRTGYWATGDRATLTTGDHTTGFYWDDDTLLNDTHTTGGAETTTASYLLGVDREARTLTHAALRYALHDRHGNTTELADAAGRITARYDYTDYGTTTVHAGANDPEADEASRHPFLYAGEYTDPTGTQHLAVRTYAPDRLSFTTLDTMPLQNRYGYAIANPITNIDPSGHFPIEDVINGAAVFAGALFTVVSAWGLFITGMGALTPAWIAAVASAATVGGLANVAGSTLAVLGFVNDHITEFLDEGTRERFTYSEFGLMALGGIAAGVVAAPKLYTIVSPPPPVGQLVTENTTPLDTALRTFKVRKYLAQRQDATDYGRRTAVYESYQSDFTIEATEFDHALNVSGVGLANVLKEYELAVVKAGSNITDLSGNELFGFLKLHAAMFRYAEEKFAAVRGAVIPAYTQKLGTAGFKGTQADLDAFDSFMPALDQTEDFRAIALLLAR